MWKRGFLLALCLILACAPIAYAAEQRNATVQPTLSFSGQTATCTCKVSEVGKNISVTMELWYGSTLVDSWSKSGTSIVLLNETCSVTRGRTYTLKVRGTSGGMAFGPTSITKTCPKN